MVISHLWPVNPKYAASFGLLLLDRLHAGSIAPGEAVLDIYKYLNRPNSQIAEEVKNMGAYSEELAGMIEKTEFEISDFRNIGAVAIYA